MLNLEADQDMLRLSQRQSRLGKTTSIFKISIIGISDLNSESILTIKLLT